jgi:Protein phosphatase 2C
MSSSLRLEAIAASVSGGRHRAKAKNSQDAAQAVVLTRADGEIHAAIAVVCDGCGSTPHAEVGAHLGVTMWQAAVSAELLERQDITNREFWLATTARVIQSIVAIADAACGQVQARNKWLASHMLFTSMVAVVHGESVAVWAIGDGIVFLDGKLTELTAADNAPIYVTYQLLNDAAVLESATLVTAATNTAGYVAVATDGVAQYPGTLRALVNEQTVRHPDALRRKLELAARAHCSVDAESQQTSHTPARLQDDASVAIIRWSLTC